MAKTERKADKKKPKAVAPKVDKKNPSVKPSVKTKDIAIKSVVRRSFYGSIAMACHLYKLRKNATPRRT